MILLNYESLKSHEEISRLVSTIFDYYLHDKYRLLSITIHMLSVTTEGNDGKVNEQRSHKGKQLKRSDCCLYPILSTHEFSR